MLLRLNILLMGGFCAALLSASPVWAASTNANAPASSSSAAHSTASASSSPAVHAAPAPPPVVHTASAPPPAAPTAARALPDYGGRDGIAGTAIAAQSSPAMNPLAQAWRAFEALVIVLALVVGGLYGLKRTGLIQASGTDTSGLPAAALPGLLKNFKLLKVTAPAPPPDFVAAMLPLQVLGTQALAGVSGASLHLVSVGGKTLLLGVTSQSVSLISEVDADRHSAPAPTLDTGRAPFSFDGFLSRAELSPQEHSNETEMLMNATTMRLQAMIARSEVQVSTRRS